jgi:YfiH family protein
MSIDRRLGPASVRFTTRTDGDMGHGGAYVESVAPDVAARRRAVLDAPWTWLRQTHGAGVVQVDAPGAGWGSRADAAVTDQSGCALAVLTADCAPVALASAEGAVGIAHAGWAGLVAGVLQTTVKELRNLGATDVQALIGPCVHAECYEFGADDLDRVADRFGPAVVGRTAAGTPALDLPAALRAALAAEGVDAVDDVGECTACTPGPRYFSWRARGDAGRQAALIWLA